MQNWVVWSEINLASRTEPNFLVEFDVPSCCTRSLFNQSAATIARSKRGYASVRYYSVLARISLPIEANCIGL
jgi:hypothetical protein